MGRRIAFRQTEGPGGGASYITDADGTNLSRVIGNASSPSWINDQHILASGVAYSDDTGRWLGSGVLKLDVKTHEVSVVEAVPDSCGTLSYPLWIGR